MPTFISRDGVWEPAKEKVIVNKKVGKDQIEPEIYEGPDRAATDELKTHGVKTFGMHYKQDNQLLMRAKQLGMTLDEYIKANEPTEAEVQKDKETKDKIVVTHQPQKKKPGLKTASGGKGFHDDNENPPLN